jgi:hypothetical protein
VVAVSRPNSPSLVGLGVAVAATLAAVALTAVSPLALLADGAGVVLIGVGLVLQARPAITLAAVALFAGVVTAALAGAPTTTLLAATVAVALAYDASENALSVARDARRAGSARVELVHAASVMVLAGVAGLAGLVAYRLSGGGSALGVVALLAGGVLVIIGLGRQNRGSSL